jgi:ABC-type phosphate transport system substrate-binding protein
LLFTIGPVQVYLSTVMFLLTLIVLLIVLARFDLVPRSLAPASTQPRPSSKGQAQRPSNDGSTNTQPGMKQGVKGANDDLYQEYRQNQRYWQRKDRKK